MFDTLNAPKLNHYFIIGLTSLSLLVYLLTLAPTVLMGDAGEFQFVAWLPGIAHPTGYPLYILLGWLFSHLFSFGEVAWRLNLFSALTGAITIGIVYLTSQELTTQTFVKTPSFVHRLIAAGAALIFAFSHTFWTQAIIAEVYGLHGLFVTLVLWACVRLQSPHVPPNKSDRQEIRREEKDNSQLATPNAEKTYLEKHPQPLLFPRLWRLAFIFGLSLTHHRTMVLMIPAILLYLWSSSRRKLSFSSALSSIKGLNGLKLIAAIILPSVLYIYLPLIAPQVPYSQLNLGLDQTLTLYEQTFSGFLNHILGRVFSGEVRPEGANIERLILSLDFLRQQVGWLGGILGLLGLISLAKRPALLWLTGGSFVGFLTFNLIYFIGDVVVLFIPCWLILSLWIGLGWLNIIVYLSDIFVKHKRTRVTDNPAFMQTARQLEQNLNQLLLIILSSLLFIFPVGLLVTRYTEVDQSQNTIAREAWLEILAQDLPQEAILLSNDRNEMMPLWYYQYVENRRPDLLGLFPLVTTSPKVANIGRLLDQVLATDRPIYLVKPMPGLEIKADLAPLPPLPHAQLIEVKRPKLSPDRPVSLIYDNRLAITGYDQTQTDEVIDITLYWRAEKASLEQNYTSYVHLVDSNGTGRAQSQDHPPGGFFYPTSLWQANEILRDMHTIRIPNNLSPGQYTLIAGLYSRPESDVIEQLGQPQTLGTVIIE